MASDLRVSFVRAGGVTHVEPGQAPAAEAGGGAGLVPRVGRLLLGQRLADRQRPVVALESLGGAAPPREQAGQVIVGFREHPLTVPVLGVGLDQRTPDRQGSATRPRLRPAGPSSGGARRGAPG